MNRQEIFEFVVNHLKRQGKRSLNDGGCAYRGDNNTSCAIGCLITDEEYKPEWENNTIDNLINYCENFPTKFQLEDSEFYASLQRLHDLYLETKWFKEKVIEVAIVYNLETKFLENV